MRRTRRTRLARLQSEINVVPYIDIMLVLLVVFMVTAPLFSQGFRVDLPAANPKPLEIKSRDQIVISVSQNGDYYYNAGKQSEQLSLNQIKTRLSQLDKDELEVFVRGDTKTDYGNIVTLMSELQGIGIEDVGLVTQPNRR